MSTGHFLTNRAALARLLAAAATALLVVFAASSLASGTPPRLLDPLWQLKLSETLINLGPVALIGFFLMPLASWCDPANRRIARDCRRLQSWGVVAVVGYLLLVPLQGLAVVQGVGDAQRSVQRQQAEAQKRISDLRLAVNAARNPKELQERFAALKAPAIPLENLSLPMAVLQQNYRNSLQTVEKQLRQAGTGPAPGQVLQLGQASLRVAISAVAFAFAFAAGTVAPGHPAATVPPGHQLTLLGEWQAKARQAREAWQKGRLRRRYTR